MILRRWAGAGGGPPGPAGGRREAGGPGREAPAPPRTGDRLRRRPVRAACTDSRLGRSLTRSFFAAYLDRVRGHHATAAYKKAMRKRGVWIEPLFGEAKQWHHLRQFRLRRCPG